jgi:peptide/nickel transport system permease protein
MLAAVIVCVFAFAALFAPLIAINDPLDQTVGPRLYPPNVVLWFGTDEFGRSVYSRVVYGSRIAFTVGIASALAAALAGSLLGLAGGYFGGLLDWAITIVVDLLYAFPTILLAIALAVVLGPSMQTVIVAIAIVQAPHFARIARGTTLQVRAQPYIESARAVGAGDLRTITRHVVPNIVPPLLVQLALSFSYAVLSESILSFLGVGNPPPAPSWGAMLSGAYGYLEQAPWASIFPGAAITILILAFNILSDGVQELLDPTRR